MAWSARARGVALVAGLAIVVAACGGDDSSSSPSTTTGSTETTTATSAADATTTTAAAEEPVYGGTLRVGIEADTSNAWFPSEAQPAVSGYVVAQSFYEALTAQLADGTVVGQLLQSMDSTGNDYTNWTMKLRPGIKFTDGEPFNAAAVVKNLTLMANSALVGAALTDMDATTLTAVDDMTVTVKTKRPWVDFPLYLAAQAGWQASPKWIDAATADATLKTKPVGTGPFILESYAPGDVTKVVKNPNYWRKDAKGRAFPYLDAIEFKVVQDAKTRESGLAAGDIDIMHTTLGETIKTWRGETDKVKVVEQAEKGETNYLLMNVGLDTSPFTDKDLRCALAAGADVQASIDALQAGVPQIANGPFSPGQPGHLDDTGNQKYDPAKAKELVAAYTARKGKPKIKFTAVNDDAALQTAQIYQQGWQDAGMEVSIVQVEQGKLITDALLGSPDFQVFNWRNHGGTTMDSQYIWWTSKNAAPAGALGLNFGRLKDDVIDQALDANRGEADPAKKKELAETVNKRFASECYIVPQFWTVWAVGSNPKVKGFQEFVEPDSGKNYNFDGGNFPAPAMWLAS